MRFRGIILCGVVLASCFSAQTVSAQAKNQAAIASVQKAAVAALNFKQGDAAGLKRAQNAFTPAGWAEYMKSLQGFLDAHNAPMFNSSFVPSGAAVVVSDAEGIHLKVPGTLTQSQGASRTTYAHSMLDVKASGTPAKIEHLETIYTVKAGAF
ncbi:MAG TPA: hypothetical protein VKB26_04130 [Candidatus Acidoferrales bacterium]|nr:hypothetical protein [Candidatus Acidoferrales bacterium]